MSWAHTKKAQKFCPCYLKSFYFSQTKQLRCICSTGLWHWELTLSYNTQRPVLQPTCIQEQPALTYWLVSWQWALLCWEHNFWVLPLPKSPPFAISMILNQLSKGKQSTVLPLPLDLCKQEFPPVLLMPTRAFFIQSQPILAINTTKTFRFQLRE